MVLAAICELFIINLKLHLLDFYIRVSCAAWSYFNASSHTLELFGESVISLKNIFLEMIKLTLKIRYRYINNNKVRFHIGDLIANFAINNFIELGIFSA